MESRNLLQLTGGKKKSNKAIKQMALAAAVLCSVGFGIAQTGAYSYLSNADAIKNFFSEGKVAISLAEPEWLKNSDDSGRKEKAVPGDVYQKDPTVAATEACVTPCFVYLQVYIPYVKVTKVNDDSTLYDKDTNGTPLKKHHMLVTFGEGELAKTSSDEFLVGDAADIRYDPASEILDSAELPDGHLISNNIHAGKDGWTLLEVSAISPADMKDADSYKKNVDGYLKFIYSFNAMLANTDAVHLKYAALIDQVLMDKTTPLFEKIRVVNCMEGQLDGNEYYIPIKAYAIQATHTGSVETGNAIPSTTAEVIKQARKAYVAYANQNEDNGIMSVIKLSS